MRLLAPFSGKFKYNQKDFPYGEYKEPRLCLENINWHYDISTDDEYEYCLEHYDKFMKEEFLLFCDSNDCIIEDQPYWDLQEDTNVNFHSNYVKSDEETKKNCSNKGIGIELLAWYEPAHFHKSDDYGVHLIPIGIVHTADILIENCKKYNLNISRRMGVVWAINILYCHELVHSWIEDIASLIEFSIGKDIYTETQRKYNSYIFMEEALCNTAVYGLQLCFLERDRYKHFETGREHQAINDHIDYVKDITSDFNKDKMLKALSDFMRSQPKGYKDFVEIDSNPNESFVFIRGLIKLFKDLYQCDYEIEDTLYDALDLYFGIDTHRVRFSKNISETDIDFSRNRGFQNSINWSNEVPIRYMQNLLNENNI